MLNQIERIFFLDIETVPQYYHWYDVPERAQELFAQKMRFLLDQGQESIEELYEKRAGILAEFNKIICISVGIVAKENGQDTTVHVRSFSGSDEKTLLSEFAELLSKNQKTYTHLCAHNGKEFDFPVICRRMLTLGIALPKILDVRSKKPWENNFIDTLELWKFGDYKHYTSLDLLAFVFNIASPKQDISGAHVAKVYYEDNDLERIVAYCERDTQTLIKVYQHIAKK